MVSRLLLRITVMCVDLSPKTRVHCFVVDYVISTFQRRVQEVICFFKVGTFDEYLNNIGTHFYVINFLSVKLMVSNFLLCLSVRCGGLGQKARVHCFVVDDIISTFQRRVYNNISFLKVGT